MLKISYVGRWFRVGQRLGYHYGKNNSGNFCHHIYQHNALFRVGRVIQCLMLSFKWVTVVVNYIFLFFTFDFPKMRLSHPSRAIYIMLFYCPTMGYLINISIMTCSYESQRKKYSIYIFIRKFLYQLCHVHINHNERWKVLWVFVSWDGLIKIYKAKTQKVKTNMTKRLNHNQGMP